MHAANKIFDAITQSANVRVWKGLNVRNCTYGDDVLYFPFPKPARIKNVLKMFDKESIKEIGKDAVTLQVDGEMYGLVFGCESDFSKFLNFGELGKHSYLNPSDAQLFDHGNLSQMILTVLQNEYGLQGKTGNLEGVTVSFKNLHRMPFDLLRADMFKFLVRHHAEMLNFNFDESEVNKIIKGRLHLADNARKLASIAVTVTNHNKAISGLRGNA